MYLKANYHTHTERCGHADGTEREYIECAIKSGIEILGFSDHSPYVFDGDYYSWHRMKVDRIDDYFKVLLDLKNEYRNDIKIHIGFEAEYYPKFFGKMLELVKDYPLDYLILGQHALDNEQDTDIWSVQPTEDEARLDKYVSQVTEAMETGKFSYVAHPDVINYTGDIEIYNRYMLKLCEKAKELDIPLEYNLLGLQGRRHYPCDKFFTLAAQTGNRVIVGCDAHTPSVIGNLDIYNEGMANLKRLGITPIETITLLKP